MSRYIDAEILIKKQWWVEIQGENIDEIAEQIIRQCKQIVKEAPSIDIVRCKECRYWKWIEWAKEYRCTLRNTAFNASADDFCSYGERKESE